MLTSNAINCRVPGPLPPRWRLSSLCFLLDLSSLKYGNSPNILSLNSLHLPCIFETQNTMCCIVSNSISFFGNGHKRSNSKQDYMANDSKLSRKAHLKIYLSREEAETVWGNAESGLSSSPSWSPCSCPAKAWLINSSFDHVSYLRIFLFISSHWSQF